MYLAQRTTVTKFPRRKKLPLHPFVPFPRIHGGKKKTETPKGIPFYPRIEYQRRKSPFCPFLTNVYSHSWRVTFVESRATTIRLPSSVFCLALPTSFHACTPAHGKKLRRRGRGEDRGDRDAGKSIKRRRKVTVGGRRG